VKQVEKEMKDKNATSDKQISQYIQQHPILKKYYTGMFTDKDSPSLPLKPFFAIYWKPNGSAKVGHWCAIYRKSAKGPIMEFDSYARNLFPQYPDTKLPYADMQKEGENNCAQRTIAKMIEIFKK